MKKIVIIITGILFIAIFLWWRAPIIGNEWNKQTLYVGLLDAWYGPSKDDKAYAMWIDDDSAIGVFKVKEIADVVGIPPHFAVIADKMEPEVADSLACWQRQGAGILLHGFRHEPWKDWSESQIDNDIRNSYHRLQEQGFDTAQIIKIIAPPHGCNTRSIRMVIKQLGCQMITGANLINPDRHSFQLGRIGINSNTDINTIRELLEKAYERRAFVIFSTHSSTPEDFSIEKTQEVLQIAKEVGFSFNIYE